MRNEEINERRTKHLEFVKSRREYEPEKKESESEDLESSEQSDQSEQGEQSEPSLGKKVTKDEPKEDKDEFHDPGTKLYDVDEDREDAHENFREMDDEEEMESSFQEDVDKAKKRLMTMLEAGFQPRTRYTFKKGRKLSEFRGPADFFNDDDFLSGETPPISAIRVQPTMDAQSLAEYAEQEGRETDEESDSGNDMDSDETEGDLYDELEHAAYAVSERQKDIEVGTTLQPSKIITVDTANKLLLEMAAENEQRLRHFTIQRLLAQTRYLEKSVGAAFSEPHPRTWAIAKKDRELKLFNSATPDTFDAKTTHITDMFLDEVADKIAFRRQEKQDDVALIERLQMKISILKRKQQGLPAEDYDRVHADDIALDYDPVPAPIYPEVSAELRDRIKQDDEEDRLLLEELELESVERGRHELKEVEALKSFLAIEMINAAIEAETQTGVEGDAGAEGDAIAPYGPIEDEASLNKLVEYFKAHMEAEKQAASEREADTSAEEPTEEEEYEAAHRHLEAVLKECDQAIKLVNEKLEFTQAANVHEHDVGRGLTIISNFNENDPNDVFDNFETAWDDLMEGREQADTFGLFSSLLDPFLLPDIEQILGLDHPLMKTLFAFPQMPLSMAEAVRDVSIVEKKALYDIYNEYKDRIGDLVKNVKTRLESERFFEQEAQTLQSLAEIKAMEKRSSSQKVQDMFQNEYNEKDLNDDFKEFQNIQSEYISKWKDIKKMREPPKSASKLYHTFYDTILTPEDKMAYEFFNYKAPDLRGLREEYLKDIHEENKYNDASLTKVKEKEESEDLRTPHFNTFYKRIIDVKTHTHQTKGGRRSNYSALIIMGNRQGTAAWGYGHAPDALIAMEKARQACTKNMVTVDLLESRTISASITSKYMRTRITLRPLPRESGVRGSTLFREFFQAIGYKDIAGDSFGARHCNRHILQALFNAIQVPILPDVKAKMLGKIVFDRNRVWHRNPVIYSF
eukprot:TRINITY_DN3585_c0_g1_i1.p1 TRINITY_DN3585_c0_g1~~TRINITY_DN3585_c0_g1_i1.p1  ORF type:complete len:1093 (-),score=518.32 TRINITY_DN3585_c0_g1_i1:134-3049(-)